MELKIKFGLGPVSFKGLSSIVRNIEAILHDGESATTGWDDGYYIEITVPSNRSLELMHALFAAGYLV